MARFLADDIADILSDDVVGEDVTVGGVGVRGFINREWHDSGDGIDRSVIVLTIASREVSSGAAVVAGGVNYTVSSVRDEGNGFLGLILARVRE